MTKPLLTAALFAVLATFAQAAVTFETDVKPIFREHCAACHNQDDAASDFAADSFERVLSGGAGGESVAAGDPDGSRLWRLVTQQEEPAMPPGGDKLPDSQLAVIRAWIEGGLLKDSGSKPVASKKPAIAPVATTQLGKPDGEPAMPLGWFREPAITAATTGPVESLAVSPWAPLVAVPWQRQVSLYHATSLELLGVVPYSDGAPRIARFSRDGSLLLVAGGRDGALGTATVYDVTTGARVATVGDELDAVLAADLSPGNRLIALGGPKKKVRVYRIDDGSLAYTCEKHTDWITALAFSPDGQLLASGDRAAGLRLWQGAEGHERGDLRGHTLAVTSLAWRPGLLASASEDGSVRLWNPDGAQVRSNSAHGGGALSVAFAPDGRLVTTGRDRLVKFWNADGAHAADLATTADAALAAAFTHDGKRVIASDWTGKVLAIDIESKAVAGELIANPPTLAQRVEAAQAKLTDLTAKKPAIDAALAQASAALGGARVQHEALAPTIAKAAARLASAERAHAEAQARAAGRAAAESKANDIIASTTTALADAAKRLEEARQAKAADLTAPLTEHAAAESLVRAAQAALGETQTLRVESEGFASTASQQRDEAKKASDAVAQQQAALPDLAPLEAAATQAAQSAKRLTAALATTEAELGAATAELEAYRVAAQTLKSRSEAAAAEVTTAEAAAAQVEAPATQAAAEAAALAAELESLQTKLEAKRAEEAATQAILEAARQAAEAAKRRAALVASLAEDFAKQKEAEQNSEPRP